MQPPTRPAGYRPEFAEEARKSALMGATDEDLARHFGIPLATLRDGALMTYTRYRPPHRAARNFWQLNRMPGEQRRKVEIEARRREGEPRHLARSELERQIARIPAARGSAADG
jgi:hypothetical protein